MYIENSKNLELIFQETEQQAEKQRLRLERESKTGYFKQMIQISIYTCPFVKQAILYFGYEGLIELITKKFPLRSSAKLLPIVGTGLSAFTVFKKFKKQDYKGVFMQTLSEIFSLIPRWGNVASIACEFTDIIRDLNIEYECKKGEKDLKKKMGIKKAIFEKCFLDSSSIFEKNFSKVSGIRMNEQKIKLVYH